MASADGTGAVLEALADHLAHSLGRPVAVLITNAGEAPAVRVRSGPPKVLHPADIKAAWSRHPPEPVMIDSWHFLRLATNREPIGLVAIHGRLDGEQIDLVRSV